MRLYLVRHGEVATRSTFYGHYDVPLSEQGKEQVQRTASALSGLAPAAIFASDLSRAVESARPIAAHHGQALTLEPALREMHIGVLEGLSFAEARTKYPDLAARSYREMWQLRFPGGGENLADVAARAQPVITRLAATYAEQTVIAVAHNSVNRVILGAALGLPIAHVFDFSQDYSCVNRIDYLPGQPANVVLLNWTPAAPRSTTSDGPLLA